MEFLILTVLLIVVAAPILAIIALVRQVRMGRRIEALEERLSKLGMAPHASQTESAREPTPPSPGRPAQTVAPEPAPDPAPSLLKPEDFAPRRGPDLESLIAGRWLSIVGILALLLATAFFLKFAFDNDWVGPRGRVAVGLLAGAALFVYSNWLSRKGYRYFADGIAGLGAGVLYLSLLAGWSFYKVFPLPAAFVGMITVTATLVVLSIGRNSQLLGVLGVIGGLLTPGLLNTGRDAQIELFSYLALLSAGMLILGRKRNWISVEWLAFGGVVLHLAAWGSEYYQAEKLVPTLLFCILFFLEFAAVPAWRAKTAQGLGASGIAQTLLNAFWFLVALHVMLYDDHRWSLTLAVLALSATHLVFANLTRADGKSAWASRVLFAGLALTMATLAIAIRLEGRWITMAWAMEGGVLAWSGFRTRVGLMRGAGLLLLGVAAARLLLVPIPADRLFLNARFLAFVVTVAGIGLALAGAWLHSGGSLSRKELILFQGLAVVANFLSVWALSAEVWDFFAAARFGVDHALAQQLGLSVLWTAYAASLIFFGAALRSKPLRWQGLALLGVVVLKVFLYDLGFLQRAYRIVSFLALGVLLLAVSYLYQRKIASPKSEAP